MVVRRYANAPLRGTQFRGLNSRICRAKNLCTHSAELDIILLPRPRILISKARVAWVCSRQKLRFAESVRLDSVRLRNSAASANESKTPASAASDKCSASRLTIIFKGLRRDHYVSPTDSNSLHLSRTHPRHPCLPQPISGETSS